MDEINNFENLVLEQLGHIRAELAAIKEDTREIKSRVINVESRVVDLVTSSRSASS